MTHFARLLAVTERTVVAFGIVGALGVDALVDDVDADLASTACEVAVLAAARVAGLHAVTERTVVAFGIAGALGIEAFFEDFDANAFTA